MDRIVYVISDPSDGDVVRDLVIGLREADFSVQHNGTVGVGKSTIESATNLLGQGVPVVICATSRSLSRPWTHKLANAANSIPDSRVFLAQMEEGLYVEQLSLSRKVAEFWKDHAGALSALSSALEACFPPEHLGHSDVVREAPHGDLDQITDVAVLDLEAIETFRGDLRPYVAKMLPGSLSAWEFLEGAHLMRDGRLTRAGVLLFATDPTMLFPAAIAQCTRYYGNTKDAPRDPIEVRGNLRQQIDGCWDFVADLVRQGDAPTSAGAQAQVVYRYPMVAVREIVANALVHRDYGDSHSCIHVRLFEDRLEIVSPGTWTGKDLGPDQAQPMGVLVGESHKRNFRLARAMAWVGRFEGEGSGIPLAVRDCREAGAPEPVVSQNDGFVTVVLRPSTDSASRVGDVRSLDVFVSYSGIDRAWAEWAASELVSAGLTVELDSRDWTAGGNFVDKIEGTLRRAERVVMLWSSSYFKLADFSNPELASVFSSHDKAGPRVLPFRVEAVTPPALLRAFRPGDLFGADEATARRALLEPFTDVPRPHGSLDLTRSATWDPSDNVGEAGPRRPGRLPSLWHVPARNPGFTGRETLLGTVRDRLLSGDRAVVQALHGMGGVGKTQTAVEYAHRFANSYDLVWWIDAERAELIGEQFAVLAVALGFAEPSADVAAVRRAVLGALGERRRWLLVFDNAESPEDIAPWLPGGAGHVLITSRASRWAEVAAPVEIDVLPRNESVKILQDRVEGLTEADADRVAAALGDLPLAMAQAAGYMDATGTSPDEYFDLLGTRAVQVLGEGRPASYPRSLAAATGLALDRLRAEDPAAADLAGLCAFLAPEPIPLRWFTHASARLPAALAQAAADPVAWRRTLAHLSGHALARLDDELRMHRLTQAIVRQHHPADEAAVIKAQAEAVLAANHPGDPGDPVAWPGWAVMLPHLLSLDPAVSDNQDLRQLAYEASWYLLARGDFHTSYSLALRLSTTWRDRLGPDDRLVLYAGQIVTAALRAMGRYQEARELDEDNLARMRDQYGYDHPDTLASAAALATDLSGLGDHQAARELDEDILARSRRVLGNDDPSTLESANSLAMVLRELGDYGAARNLDEDTLAIRRRVLGQDHPSTLASANNLAVVLRELGEHHAARDLDEDTLARYRRVLGEDHPATLASALNLATDLREMGDFQTARQLDEDTVTRYRRVLGEDHPATLACARNLAADLHELGEDVLVRREKLSGMELVTLIATALTAGVTSVVPAGVERAVEDAYATLRTRVKTLFANRPSGQDVLARHGDTPQAAEKALATELYAAGAEDDADLVAAAKAVMSLLDQAEEWSGKYAVTVRESKGVQIGDHNVQSNVFGSSL
jgi:tetratricopeptide (TPR) repeat protein